MKHAPFGKLMRGAKEAAEMSRSSRTKPCPFCGNRVTVQYGGRPEARHILFFRCDEGCGAVVSFRSTVAAVDAWNKRENANV